MILQNNSQILRLFLLVLGSFTLASAVVAGVGRSFFNEQIQWPFFWVAVFVGFLIFLFWLIFVQLLFKIKKPFALFLALVVIKSTIWLVAWKLVLQDNATLLTLSLGFGTLPLSTLIVGLVYAFYMDRIFSQN